MGEKRSGDEERRQEPGSRPNPPTPPVPPPNRRLYFGDVSDAEAIAEALQELRRKSLEEKAAHDRKVERYERDLQAYKEAVEEEPDDPPESLGFG